MHSFDEGDGEALAVVLHDLGVGSTGQFCLTAGKQLEDLGCLWGEHAVSREDEWVEGFTTGFADGSAFGGFLRFAVGQRVGWFLWDGCGAVQVEDGHVDDCPGAVFHWAANSHVATAVAGIWGSVGRSRRLGLSSGWGGGCAWRGRGACWRDRRVHGLRCGEGGSHNGSEGRLMEHCAGGEAFLSCEFQFTLDLAVALMDVAAFAAVQGMAHTVGCGAAFARGGQVGGGDSAAEAQAVTPLLG